MTFLGMFWKRVSRRKILAFELAVKKIESTSKGMSHAGHNGLIETVSKLNFVSNLYGRLWEKGFQSNLGIEKDLIVVGFDGL